MTIEKIICGTLEEVGEYFSFVGTGQTKWHDDLGFDAQISSFKHSVGLIFYLDKKGGLKFERNWIFIRNYEHDAINFK